MTVEIKFLRDWQDCKAGETKKVGNSSQTVFVGKDGAPSLNIICNDRGDHAGINLNPKLGLNLEILESGSDQVKIDSEFSELRLGNQIRIVDGLGVIAEISHQSSLPEQMLTPKVRSSFIERWFPFMRRR